MWTCVYIYCNEASWKVDIVPYMSDIKYNIQPKDTKVKDLEIRIEVSSFMSLWSVKFLS